MMHRAQRRRGAALIAAMVILTVLGILIGTATIHIARTRLLLINRANVLQARWLAHAGIELAIDRLREGELETAVIEPIAAARVTVTVKKDPAAADRFVIRAAVEYPTDGVNVIRTTLEKAITRVDGRIEVTK